MQNICSRCQGTSSATSLASSGFFGDSLEGVCPSRLPRRPVGRDVGFQVVAVNRRIRRYREKTGYYWKLARVPKTQYPRPWGEEDQSKMTDTDELDVKITGMPTGMCVTWLGTSSGAPTLHRNVSSICVRWPNKTFVFDAGEGTQVQMLKADIFPAHVRRIFITHLHGDHCFGLPGLLNLVSKIRLYHLKGEMLNIYGPPGLEQLLRMSLPYWYDRFRMPITVTEFCWDEESAHEPREVAANGMIYVARMAPTSSVGHMPGTRMKSMTKRGLGVKLAEGVFRGYQWEIECEDGVKVTAAQLQHRVPCWGYVVKEPDYSPAEWEYDPKNPTVKPPPARTGRKAVILGDTCNSDALAKVAQNADMVSHEATFARGMEEKAQVAQHSTAYMAGEFAKKIDAKSLILTHFSGRYQRPAEAGNYKSIMGALIAEAKQGFGKTSVAAASDFFTYDIPLNGESGLVENELDSELDSEEELDEMEAAL
ncbi:hypothetical protein BSKO_07623 [Bryopsis sp. KO-2023]|nr:hypothetical protein BSKO_07623 [Bryopsis sp. KO-2023]